MTNPLPARKPIGPPNSHDGAEDEGPKKQTGRVIPAAHRFRRAEPAPGPLKRILVVEDDPGLLDMVREILDM
ncbi:MAG: hypothetical protein EXR67_04845 [Dehalococcoidia bacterium]|nr:hypothetical protein [Dehalococcoidia bacterium]